MRDLREKPRVTVAKLLAVLLVFAAGMAFAGVLSDDSEVPPDTAAALTRAERAAQTRSDRLAEAEAEVERLEARARRLERRLSARDARSRRLTRALRSARRQVAELQP
jgi:predicted RNase H-like nuclease (RuvC/YqgF family)